MSDPIGSSLEFLAGFDLFSLLWNVGRNLLSGPTHTFFVPLPCGVPELTIVDLLKRHGIKNWGHLEFDGYFTITVHRRQAAWAQYLLDRENIPVVSRRVPGGAKPQEQKRAAADSQRERRQAKAQQDCTMFEYWWGS